MKVNRKSLVMINPVIESRDGEVVGEEGCISLRVFMPMCIAAPGSAILTQICRENEYRKVRKI
jgi:peptide deformylase